MNSTLPFNPLAIRDFRKAISKANWRNWFSKLTGRKNNLLSLREALRAQQVTNRRHIGCLLVPLANIVGSEQRSLEFDRAFLPRQTRTKDRWLRIDTAYHQGITLPPVELIKVDCVYFVRDGNHRVSVARMQGQEFIDACVTEVVSPTLALPKLCAG